MNTEKETESLDAIREKRHHKSIQLRVETQHHTCTSAAGTTAPPSSASCIAGSLLRPRLLSGRYFKEHQNAPWHRTYMSRPCLEKGPSPPQHYIRGSWGKACPMLPSPQPATSAARLTISQPLRASAPHTPPIPLGKLPQHFVQGRQLLTSARRK